MEREAGQHPGATTQTMEHASEEKDPDGPASGGGGKGGDVAEPTTAMTATRRWSGSSVVFTEAADGVKEAESGSTAGGMAEGVAEEHVEGDAGERGKGGTAGSGDGETKGKDGGEENKGNKDGEGTQIAGGNKGRGKDEGKGEEKDQGKEEGEDEGKDEGTQVSEDREVGRVRWSTWKAYLSNVASPFVLVLLSLVMVGGQVLQLVLSWWFAVS